MTPAASAHSPMDPTLLPARERAPRWLRAFPWLLTGLWVVWFGLHLGPFINEDSLFGLYAARDYAQGAPWNHLVFPDPSALDQTRSAFLAWWAPAQWLLPDLFQRTGLPLGWALTATSALAAGAGLLGWRRLYLKLGYSEFVAGASLALIALMSQFWQRFAEYHGGEILLFGALPWIVLGALRLGLGWRALLLLPLLLLVGGFIKLSFSISALAIVAALWLREHLCWPPRRRAVSAAIVAGGSFLIFYAVFAAGYLRRGATPDAAIGERGWPELPFMPTGPLSFLLGGQQLSGRFLAPFDGPGMVFWGVFASAVVIGLLLVACRESPSRVARAALLSFYVINVAAIGFLYWRGNRVWFIDRIFMPAGLLLLPALVHLMAQGRTRWGRWLCLGLFSASSVYSIFHAWQFSRWDRAATAASPRRIRHLGLDQAQLQSWVALGRQAPAGAVVFYLDPSLASLALEWPNARCYVRDYAVLYGPPGAAPWFRGRPALLGIVGSAASPIELQRFRQRFSEVAPADWRQDTFGRAVLSIATAPSREASR